MRRLLAWLIVLLPFAAMAQSVQQSGRVTPGHPTMWTTDGVVQDAGTPAQGGLTGLGITSSNLQSQCINNGPPTGPYNSLCFGINGTQAQITLSNFGGAPGLPFYCVINGVTSPCIGAAGTFLPLSGGTLSGPLILSGDPTLSLGAATKHYVDTSPPVGGPFLPIVGGTLSGPLILSGDPTLSLGAATKHYVDSSLPVGGPFLPLIGGALGGPGNLSIGGTLGVTGATTLTGGVLTDSVLPIGTTLSLGTTVATIINVGSATGATKVGGTLGVTGATTLGSGGAAPITIGSGSIAVASGQNIAMSLGGSGHTLTFSGTGGTGTLATLTAIAGASTIDYTTSAGVLVKSYFNEINPSGLVWSGAYSATKSPLHIAFSPSGTITPVSGGSQYMSWTIAGDHVSLGTGNTLNMIDLIGTAGGPAMTGNRSVLTIGFQQTASTGNAGGGSIFQAGQASSDVSYNEGGTALTSALTHGANYAWPEYARMHTGATYFYVNKAKEIDLQVATGASTLKNIGIDVDLLAAHAVQGAYDDYAYGVQVQPGAAVGFKSAMQFGTWDGIDPFGPNSRIINWSVSGNPVLYPPQAAAGVDLSLGTISGNAFASRDFRVASGAIYPFQGAITQTGSGISLDIPNYIIGYTSIASGGTGNTAGDWYEDATSGMIVALLTTTSGGVAATASIVRVGYQAAAPGSPVTVTDMNPDNASQTFTINASATLNATLSLGATFATAINIGRSGQNTTIAGLFNLPGIVTAANCTGQPTKSIIAITGTGVLTQCP